LAAVLVLYLVGRFRPGRNACSTSTVGTSRLASSHRGVIGTATARSGSRAPFVESTCERP